jgi:indolepyruvate ferredoxin oxidoreductase
LVVGCDLVVAAGQDAVQTYDLGRTRAIINDHVVPVAAFTLSPDLAMDRDTLTALVADSIGREQAEFIDSTKLATALMGDSIAANLFLLGVAFQRGTIPLSLSSIEMAIELNGIAVDANKRSFAWGRKAAADQKAVEEIALPAMPKNEMVVDTLDQTVAKRMDRLKAYQSARYANRYGKLVAAVLAAEEKAKPGSTIVSGAVARYFYKLMAYKDEYEVARLYSDGAFAAKVNDQFEGDFKVKFHLAPPIFAKRHEETGHLIKKEFGPWMMKSFGVLAKLRFLRGTALDPFGKSEERKSERALIGEYEATMVEICETLNADNLLLAAEIAEVPEHIRGYGHVKEQHLSVARAMREDLLSRFHHGEVQPMAAE